MEKDGLVALRDENVVSFSSNKEGWGFTLDGGVFPLSCTKAEVFLLLFNRRLGPFRDEKIVKSYKIFYNRPGAHEQVCLSRCFLLWLKSCCIKKISRPFPWLWEPGYEIAFKYHLRIYISPWLLILLNFCSILEFSDAANLYIPDYPTKSCAPPPLLQRTWGPPLPLFLRGRVRLQVG